MKSTLRALVCVSLLVSCAAQKSVPPANELMVWFRPMTALADPVMANQAELIGSWNDWQRPGITDFANQTDAAGTLWRRAAVTLPNGVYEYAIVVGDQLLLDEGNPQTAFVADPLGRTTAPFSTEVSRAVIAQPALTITSRTVDPTSIAVEAKLNTSVPQLAAQLWQGASQLKTLAISQDGSTVHVTEKNLPAGKYTVRFVDQGANATLASASGFIEASPPREQQDGLIYQIMIDRFMGDNGPLVAPVTPGDRAGGTLKGVQNMIDAGYFAALGVTTLWLSPVYQNPDGYFAGTDGHLYTSYHGYWPSDPRAVESRFGGEAALDALVAVAHASGLRIILDVVPHHVHAEHPYWSTESASALAAAGGDPTQSWFLDSPTQQSCLCGIGACDWATHILQCWFDPYLPTLNWQNPAVADQEVADLNYYMTRFDVDGVRIDAVPMMPRMAARRIERGLYDTVTRGAPGSLDFFIVGENFVGAGDGGRAELAEYLGRDVDGLDSEFDFPLMWEMRDVIAHDLDAVGDLEVALSHSVDYFAGSQATMAHMIDNHDTTRFISEAVGNAGNDPWADPPAQPTDAAPYARQWMALVYSLTSNSIPVIYYGDEVGLAGATDPDSRRVMPGDLLPVQLTLRQHVQALGTARACSSTLRRGTRVTRYVDPDVLVVELTDANGAALIVESRAANAQTVALTGLHADKYQDIISHAMLDASGGHASLAVPPLSAAVYLSAPSSCLP